MDLAAILPDPIAAIPESERASRARIGDDFCSLDGEHLFVRAVLYVPIRQTTHSLGFGAWGSLAQANFKTYFDEFDNPEPEFGPFFSWLCSSLPPYDSAGLESQMVFQRGNQRPHINLNESDHPLSIAQREGITVEDVVRIYEAWGHSAIVP